MTNTGVLVGVGVLILVQLTLQVIALVQLVKTPRERVSIGGRKWVWALIILLGEVIGPILWFVIGKTPATVELAPAAPVNEADRNSTVDALYGKPPEQS